MNIVLIGMPGCGKSTIGKNAAKQLNMDFVDTDALVEKQEGRSISEIFMSEGEAYFRKIEASIIREIARECGHDTQSRFTGVVVSVGGGAPMFVANVEAMRDIGAIVLIDRPIALIEETVSYNDDRPLLTDKDRLRALFEERMPLFHKLADKVIVNDADVNRVVDEIAAYVKALDCHAEPVPCPDTLLAMTGDFEYAVIGDPIGHSLSPKLHNAIYTFLGIDASYGAICVSSDSLKFAISEIRSGKLRGMNVTIPHKQAIIPYLDEIVGDAETSGAVNTVVRRDGRLIGYNTDMEGLKLALGARGVTYKDKNVIVFGSGGAAAGIARKATDEGASSVTLVSRSATSKVDCHVEPVPYAVTVHARTGPTLKPVPPHRVSDTTSGYIDYDFTRHPARSEAESQDPALKDALALADILINATPLGMSGSGRAFADFTFLDDLKNGAFVCDLVYNPAESALLREAKSRGFETMNGLPMLIYQGILSDEIFFSERSGADFTADREKIFETAFAALSQDY